MEALSQAEAKRLLKFLNKRFGMKFTCKTMSLMTHACVETRFFFKQDKWFSKKSARFRWTNETSWKLIETNEWVDMSNGKAVHSPRPIDNFIKIWGYLISKGPFEVAFFDKKLDDIVGVVDSAKHTKPFKLFPASSVEELKFKMSLS